MSIRAVTLAACGLALSVPGSAGGAIFGDANVGNPTLKVSAKGIALVEYTTMAGLKRRVLVLGAIDGLAHQTDPTVHAVELPDGLLGRLEEPGESALLARSEHPVRALRRPGAAVLRCRLQGARRHVLGAAGVAAKPADAGLRSWTERQRGVELHVSHWSGELPEFQLFRHWTYGAAHQGIFGRLLYRGAPVFGTRTPSASVRDEWSRNVYIDTFNSDFGPGWRHDMAIATHVCNGGFCDPFVPQRPARLPEHEAERQRPRGAPPDFGYRTRA